MLRLDPLASLFFLLAGPTLASAQLIDVPGDYTDLQDAIDAASPGATILVHGGTFQTLTIDKALTIIGQPAPLIEGAPSGATFLPPITLAGPGTGEVVLARIRVEDTVNGLFVANNAPAITGGGFSELHVHDSFIHAPEWFNLTGLGIGEPGIEVSVPFVMIERSDVKGAATNIDDTIGTTAWDGAHGITAPGTVAVYDSVVTGGDSGLFNHPNVLCDFVCPGGSGGNGIVADRVFHSDSTITGGFGAAWLSQAGFICCGGPNGIPVMATTEVSQPNLLDAEGPLRVGGSYLLQLSAASPLAILRLSRGINNPVLLPQGYRFLDPSTTVSLGTVPTPGTFALPIPGDPALIGQIIALQLVHPNTGFSRPVAAVVQPPLMREADLPSGTVTRSL
jgi:hypothetical protein